MRPGLTCFLSCGMALMAGPVPAFLVKRQGAALSVVRVEVPEGQPLTLRPGVDVVAVVVPVSEGQSADLVRVQDGLQVTLETVADRLKVRVRRGASDREVLDRPLAELQRLRVRVHATTGEGLRGRWRIEGWATAAPEAGPVMNLFAGQIPLGPQDAVLTTQVEVAPAATASPAASVLPLTWEKGHPKVTVTLAGKALPAVVDTAAAATIVGTGALPPGQAVTPATMTEHSQAGRRTLALEAQGAGGATAGFGTTTVPLALGGRPLGPTPVLVPTGAGTPAGLPEVILGLDLLVPLGCLHFERTPAGSWELRVGPRTAGGPPPGTELPLVPMGALFGVEARLDGRRAFLVLDTGSPHTFLPQGLAKEAGWALREVPGPAPRGLDGRPLSVKAATAGTLDLAGWRRPAQPVRVADLPVLAKFTGELPVGLLGNDVLGSARAFELDFREGRLRIWP